MVLHRPVEPAAFIRSQPAVDSIPEKSPHYLPSPMTPTLENIHVFAEGLGIAILLLGLFFIVQKISGRKMSGFMVFALGLPIVGFASKYVGDWKTWRNEATTSGIVVAHDLPNHNQYQFEYAMSGHRYYSWHQGTTDCDAGEINVGKTILVYYDPIHPEKADLCSFRGAIRNDLQILGLLSGMLVLIAVFTAVEKRRDNRRRSN
jgi:Protein of unknown function (DUF3592)